MKLSELPSSVRVKLTQKGEKELWKMVDEFGGVKQFSDVFDTSASKMYNWRNKDVYYPIDFVRRVLGVNCSDKIAAIKGRSRSRPIKNPELPFRIDDELLTRVSTSVYINNEGVPVYTADEKSLVERFNHLLQRLGDVPVSVYHREKHELRYPKYLQEIIELVDYSTDIGALIDETGEIRDDQILLGDRKIDAEAFEGELYSERKRFDLALARNDTEAIEQIMKDEVRKVSSMRNSF